MLMLIIAVMLPSVAHGNPAVARPPRSLRPRLNALWTKTPAEFTAVVYVCGRLAVNEHFAVLPRWEPLRLWPRKTRNAQKRSNFRGRLGVRPREAAPEARCRVLFHRHDDV